MHFEPKISRTPLWLHNLKWLIVSLTSIGWKSCVTVFWKKNINKEGNPSNTLNDIRRNTQLTVAAEPEVIKFYARGTHGTSIYRISTAMCFKCENYLDPGAQKNPRLSEWENGREQNSLLKKCPQNALHCCVEKGAILDFSMLLNA